MVNMLITRPTQNDKITTSDPGVFIISDITPTESEVLKNKIILFCRNAINDVNSVYYAINSVVCVKLLGLWVGPLKSFRK